MRLSQQTYTDNNKVFGVAYITGESYTNATPTIQVMVQEQLHNTMNLEIML